jgi:multidrug resistance efflux pump
MKKTIFLLFFLIISGAIMVACAPAAEAQPDPVAAGRAGLVIAEGRLLPSRFVDVISSVGGQVDEVMVADGDWVHNRQMLVTLQDIPEFHEALARARQEQLVAQQELDNYLASADINLSRGQLDVITARSRFNTAKDNYNSGRSTERKARMDEAEGLLRLAEKDLRLLEENNGLLPSAMEALEARLSAAETAVITAQSAVDALTLRAPINGNVADVSIQPGQKISAGEVLLAVADFSEWVVETDSLTEIEVVRIVPGQKVEVVLDALPNLILTGEVKTINSRFEEKRGDITYTVTALLEKGDPQMRWGMTAAVFFLP